MNTETLSKLYLELANVLPAETKSAREIAFRNSIVVALRHLDHATPRQRNGPVYKAADTLRKAIGLGAMEIGGKPSEGTPPARSEETSDAE